MVQVLPIPFYFFMNPWKRERRYQSSPSTTFLFKGRHGRMVEMHISAYLHNSFIWNRRPVKRHFESDPVSATFLHVRNHANRQSYNNKDLLSVVTPIRRQFHVSDYHPTLTLDSTRRQLQFLEHKGIPIQCNLSAPTYLFQSSVRWLKIAPQ